MQLGVSTARRVVLEKQGSKIPQPVTVQGIIDTGATNTCIDPSVVKSLGLAPIGKADITTPSTGKNPAIFDQYDVSITIFSTTEESPYWIANLPVIESELDHQGFQILIGRDVLSQCLLTYDGKLGQYTLAF